MLNVTLSRIHHLIKNLNDENGRINDRLCNSKLSFNFTIFSNTQEEDLALFQERVRKRKEELLSLRSRQKLNLLYMTYLKDVLAIENQKNGIDLLLNKSSRISCEIRYLKEFLSPFDNVENQDIEIIKNVDFYKTTFTDQMKSYVLPIFMFTEAEINDLRNRLNELILQQQEINDEIASRNQSNKVKIKKLETFSANLENNAT